ncbi:hypothetical protein E1B28_003255 [Marasmius oreades]|uniref:Uncharacterized protein n=1 Tax=Marasmius oreades TaxID=181124 RepID=A0A9P7UM71_9AGAR|nr:uncharacterized protein E1B28_003255 [Marasmius oreades]KAG7085711.1 hypothetical protein E1B28_003255 [Marasmius oreades]
MPKSYSPSTAQAAGPSLAGQGLSPLSPPFVPRSHQPNVNSPPHPHLPKTQPQPDLRKSSAYPTPPSPPLAQPKGRSIYSRHYRLHTLQQGKPSSVPSMTSRPAPKRYYPKTHPPNIQWKPPIYRHPSSFRGEYRNVTKAEWARICALHTYAPCPGGTFPLRNTVPSTFVPLNPITPPHIPFIPRTVRNFQQFPQPNPVRFHRSSTADAQQTFCHHYTQQWRLEAMERVAMCVREFVEMMDQQRGEFQIWLIQAQLLLETLAP